MTDILIVEDNLDIADLMNEYLSAEGHVVRIAHDGEQGLFEMNMRLPELILLDIEMPVLDGPGMAIKMLLHDAGYEDIPVVILSGVADIEQVAQRVNTPYYLVKPFKIENLMKKIEEALKGGKGIGYQPSL